MATITINEMRKELNEVRKMDPVVNRCLIMADEGGACGEDRYVILAYHLYLYTQQLVVSLNAMEKTMLDSKEPNDDKQNPD